ncbi:MAG: hypothetical protein AAB922_02545 [Patescibacteria group bacterium]
MNIQNLSDEELEKEIRGRCITNMAAEDLAKFIRQCVADSPAPTPEIGVREALEDLLDTIHLHSIGVTGDYRSINDGELEQSEERAQKALLAAKTGGPSLRALDEKRAFDLGAMFVRALQGDYDLVNHYAKEIQIDFKDGKPYCPTFGTPSDDKLNEENKKLRELCERALACLLKTRIVLLAQKNFISGIKDNHAMDIGY